MPKKKQEEKKKTHNVMVEVKFTAVLEVEDAEDFHAAAKEIEKVTLENFLDGDYGIEDISSEEIKVIGAWDG